MKEILKQEVSFQKALAKMIKAKKHKVKPEPDEFSEVSDHVEKPHLRKPPRLTYVLRVFKLYRMISNVVICILHSQAACDLLIETAFLKLAQVKHVAHSLSK